jgi:hypothetical protein
MKPRKITKCATTLLWLLAFAVSVFATDYKWPERGKDPYPWPQGKDAAKILRVRFEQASKTTFGNKKDVEQIKQLTLAHMKNPKSSVDEIRWLSPVLVIVHSSWYTSPEAAASYFYVLDKKGDKWEVLTYYLLMIS